MTHCLFNGQYFSFSQVAPNTFGIKDYELHIQTYYKHFHTQLTITTSIVLSMSFSFNNHFSNTNNNITTLDITKFVETSSLKTHDDDHFALDDVIYPSYSDFPPGFSPSELLNSPSFLSSSNVCYTLTSCVIIIILVFNSQSYYSTNHDFKLRVRLHYKPLYCDKI